MSTADAILLDLFRLSESTQAMTLSVHSALFRASTFSNFLMADESTAVSPYAMFILALKT